MKPLAVAYLNEPASGYGSRVTKPQISARNAVTEEDIQAVLARNPSKRQNVAFLQGLLDSQLTNLGTNLRAMQQENSEIETETIQRL